MGGGKMRGGKRAKKKKELLGLTLSHVVPLMTARKVGENEWGKSAKKQIFCTDILQHMVALMSGDMSTLMSAIQMHLVILMSAGQVCRQVYVAI